jgi:hypothetical protein
MHIVDTPGILAGQDAKHDMLSERQIMDTHLLIFIITTEMFERGTGDYFRNLAFTNGRAAEMMLVVNKCDMDDGGPDVKRHDIELVTSPLKMEDFRTTFVSGRKYLMSVGVPVGTKKRFLEESSGVSKLLANINAFARERGNLGRLTTPLVAIQSIASQAAGLVDSTTTSVKTAIELLSRRSRILRESRSRLREALQDLLDANCAVLSEIGAKASLSLDPEGTKEEGEAFMTAKIKEFEDVATKMEEEAGKVINTEYETVAEEMNQLESDNLVTLLSQMIGAATLNKPAPGPQMDTQAQASLQQATSGAFLVSIGSGLKKVGNWGLELFPNGLKAAQVAGGNVHKFVYSWGKWAGVKFKPWGAVKIAANFGKFVAVIGVVGVVMEVAGLFADESQKKEHAKKLRAAKDEVKANFDQRVKETRKHYQACFAQTLKDIYNASYAENDELIEKLESRGEHGKLFREISEEAKRLMKVIEKFEMGSNGEVVQGLPTPSNSIGEARQAA